MKRECWIFFAALCVLMLSACGAEPPADNEPEPPVVTQQPITEQTQEEITPPAEVTIGHQTFPTDSEELILEAQLQSDQTLDLTPLKWCTSLKSLSINLTVTPHVYFDEGGNTAVSEMSAVDLSPLANLSCVEELFLNVGAVQDLAPLAQMGALHELSLRIEDTIDLSPLADCPNLRRLALEGSRMVDLAPLSQCAELSYLRVWIYDENGDTPDLSALSGAPKLETLSIDGHKGLSELRDVPLRSVVDLANSDSILKNLPALDTLEVVEISDKYLTDIAPLVDRESVKQIILSVCSGQEFDNLTTFTEENLAELDRLVTAIPVEQLKEFLKHDGGSITIFCDWNRTSGFMGGES